MSDSWLHDPHSSEFSSKFSARYKRATTQWSWHLRTKISQLHFYIRIEYQLREWERQRESESEMADQQLLSQQERTPNGCIVAAVNGPATTPTNNNDISKLKNCSNGDVNGPNSINQKNGSTNKIIYEFSTNETPAANEPPDGGARAWCVMISAFFCNSIIFGIINTCGNVYVKLVEHLKEMGDAEASSKACKWWSMNPNHISINSIIFVSYDTNCLWIRALSQIHISAVVKPKSFMLFLAP